MNLPSYAIQSPGKTICKIIFFIMLLFNLLCFIQRLNRPIEVYIFGFHCVIPKDYADFKEDFKEDFKSRSSWTNAGQGVKHAT